MKGSRRDNVVGAKPATGGAGQPRPSRHVMPLAFSPFAALFLYLEHRHEEKLRAAAGESGPPAQ